jgi:hypothetical protein
VNECEAGNSPPDTGGVDATSKRSRAASFNGADGVVGNGTHLEEVAVSDRFHTAGILATSSDVWHRQRDSGAPKERILKHVGNPNHPVCAAAVAPHLFLNGAATPPVSGGELPAWHLFTASVIGLQISSFATTSEDEKTVVNSQFFIRDAKP